MKQRKNKMQKTEFLPVVGKTKTEILDLLGDEFNFYPDTEWHYVLSKTWYGRKKILYLEFKNDIVIRKSIITTYGKF